MTQFEDIMVILLALARLSLFGLVIWFVVREIRKGGRTRKDD